MIHTSEVRFIDLFSGIGGFHLALESQGAKCVYACEMDKRCRSIYLENFKDNSPWLENSELFPSDINDIVFSKIPDHEIICAGFPCQPFSISGKQAGFDDERGGHIFNIAEIAKAKQTKVLLLENVQNLYYHNNKKTFQEIIRLLESIGYKVAWQILNANDFGVPQARLRLIIVASRTKMFDFSKLQKSQKVNIQSILEPPKNHEYIDPNEYTLIPTEIWKEQESGLIFCGYRNKNIRNKGVRENTIHLSRTHKQPNRIYHTQGAHPTLSALELSGRYWIFDGVGVRKLSLNECYALQGFPSDFKKHPTSSTAYKQIGNSVAVPMIKQVYEQIIKQQLISDN